MTKTKTTKKALLASAMSLILCFTMLLGTTFAWFTDSVTAGNNVIKSGNLDIELEYWNGDAWEDVSGKSDILTNMLWEPGVTEIAYLRVANAGSLALKYQLGINIVSETAGINMAGNLFKLSDYINFGVVEGVNGETGAYATREAAVAAVTGAKKISAGYTKAASMAAGDELYLALVVYMPTTVENEANHVTGTNAPTIDLGINVFATQMTSEEDSFGKDYDKEAPWTGIVDTTWYNATATSFTLTKAEQLAGLAEIVNSGTDTFEGKTVTLAADVDLNNVNWTPIGSSASQNTKFCGTFIGTGYTISNLRSVGSKNVGLFGCTFVGAHIEGVTVENAYVSGNDYVGVILGGGYIASDCIKNCTVTDATVIATPYYDNAKGAYDGGAKAGVIAGQVFNGHLIGNTAKNSTVIAYRDLGGIAGMLAVDGSFTVEASGNTVENVTLSYVGVAGVYDDGVTPNKNMAAVVGRVGNNATVADDNVCTESDIDEGNKNAIMIFTYDELVAFANAVNNGQSYAGKTVILGADIDLMNNEWTPIGTYANPFKGTFDGNGKTISNLKVVLDTETTQRASLFGQANNAVIKNLTVNNVTAAALARVSGIVASATSTTVDNCHVTGDINLCGYQYVGAIVGNGYVTVKNCSVAGTVDNYADYTVPSGNNYGKMYMGGIVGWMGEGNSSITNCSAKYLNLTTNGNVGAITGLSHYGNTLTDCIAENVNITANTAVQRPGTVGLIAGGCGGTKANPSYFNNCSFANVVATDGGEAVKVMYGSAPTSSEGNIIPAYAIVNGFVSVSSTEDLQAALDAATGETTILFGANMIGDVTIPEKNDVKITIDGMGYQFKGIMTINGNSARNSTAATTIQNVNFYGRTKTTDGVDDAYVRVGTRYTDNVSVLSCHFDGTNMVAVKTYTGGDENLVIKKCTVTASMHSLAQLAGVDGALIEDCTFNSKNGINVNQSDNIVIAGCTANVQGYAVRFGAGSGTAGTAEIYLIKDCTLKSACAESGDAVIILRGTADKATLTIENTTIEGTPDILNNASDATVNR